MALTEHLYSLLSPTWKPFRTGRWLLIGLALSTGLAGCSTAERGEVAQKPAVAEAGKPDPRGEAFIAATRDAKVGDTISALDRKTGRRVDVRVMEDYISAKGLKCRRLILNYDALMEEPAAICLEASGRWFFVSP